MAQNDLEGNLEKAYTQVFYTLLMEKISKCDKVDLKNLSEKNRNEIGVQTSRRSVFLAQGFVSEMKKRGYIDRKPTDDELRVLFAQYLAEINPKT
jgi:hypothetical protein